MSRIAIVYGHPDASSRRFLHALARAYAEGAAAAGHECRWIRVAELDFPLLRTNADFRQGRMPGALREAQETLRWAEHWVVLYPLWLGAMPALLKGFFEQVLRPGFAFGEAQGRGLPQKLLAGRSAHVVVTMGMPGFFYRWYYRAHSLRSLERNILAFVGVRPVRASIVGMVEGVDDAERRAWLARMRAFGAKAA